MSEENFGIKYLYRICPGSSIRNILTGSSIHCTCSWYLLMLIYCLLKHPKIQSALPMKTFVDYQDFRFYLIDWHVIYIPGSKCVRRVMHFPLIFANIFVLLQLVVFTTGLIMIEFWCIYLM